MNIIRRFKKALIQRNLEKRKLAHPFDAEAAERCALPLDAPEAAINSYYFTCHDMKGTSLLLRFALRGEGHSEGVVRISGCCGQRLRKWAHSL